MATNNSANNSYTNNADGFSLAGGTTPRTLTLTAGNVTLSSGGSNTYTMPSATDTLVGRASTDTLTNKTITSTTNSVSYATFTNPYKFSAYRNSAANIGAGFTKIVFDTELYDTGSNFASGTFTAPVAGFYHFEWLMAATVAAGNGVSALYKNGTIFVWGNEYPAGGGSSGGYDIQAAANDTFDIYGATSGTTILNVGGSPIKTYFTGHLISTT